VAEVDLVEEDARLAAHNGAVGEEGVESGGLIAALAAYHYHPFGALVA
jgi:hypothetical protein